MKRNPHIHNRQSIRLKGYDYAQAGLYFITLCTQRRQALFGSIQNGTMHLNAAGEMIAQWYYKLESKFRNTQCHQMIIMPNHFHCILQILEDSPEAEAPEPAPSPVRADPCVCPNSLNISDISSLQADTQVCPNIPRMVQWFKTMTTNEYIRGVKTKSWQAFDGKLWQRNYWEHIIRNQMAYHNIRQYIINNPRNWKNDKLHTL